MDDGIKILLSSPDYDSIQKGISMLRDSRTDGFDMDLVDFLRENISSNSKAAILKNLLSKYDCDHLSTYTDVLTSSIIQLLESMVLPIDLLDAELAGFNFNEDIANVDGRAYIEYTDEVDRCLVRYLRFLGQCGEKVKNVIFEYFVGYDGPLYADVANFASYCSSNRETVHLFLKKAQVSKVRECQEYCLDQVSFTMADPGGLAIKDALESSLDNFFLDSSVEPSVKLYLLNRFGDCPYPRIGSYIRKLRDKRYGVGLCVLFFVELRSRLHASRILVWLRRR